MRKVTVGHVIKSKVTQCVDPVSFLMIQVTAGQEIKNKAGICRHGLKSSWHLRFNLQCFSLQIVINEEEDASYLLHYTLLTSFTHFFPNSLRAFNLNEMYIVRETFPQPTSFPSPTSCNFCTVQPAVTRLIKTGQQVNTLPNIKFDLGDLGDPTA